MSYAYNINIFHFNSQPHKEADYHIRTEHIQLTYFNSQPHKEADGNKYWYSLTLNISTHSLTRRLTLADQIFGDFYVISTHSLTRRLTFRKTADRTKKIFQLTASQGG